MPSRDFDKDVGKALSRVRRSRRMTQRLLGRYIGVAPQTVHKMEKGEIRISAGQLYLAAQALASPIKSFFPRQKALKQSPRLLSLQRLLSDFQQIRSPKLQEMVVLASRALANHSGATKNAAASAAAPHPPGRTHLRAPAAASRSARRSRPRAASPPAPRTR
ncbi:helix-turn-helix transcriptional regulator [Roseomonas fluvialis]|uniref:helix-turn-helix transcriptional regulator n=1 Tax=Roseomonas fluvialis TaxID=1750527 RepID=UPI003C6E4DA2